MEVMPVSNTVPPLQNTPPQEPAPEVPQTETPKRRIPMYVLPLLFIVLAIGTTLLLRNLMTTQQPEEPVVTQAVPKPLFLSLDTPGGMTTAVNSEVLISGTTLPDTSVMIYSDTDDTDTISDANGKFSGTVLVSETGGLVEVSAFGESGEEVYATLDLTQARELSDASQMDVLGKTDAPGQLKKQDTVVVVSETKTAKAAAKPVKPNAIVTIDPTMTPVPLEQEKKIKQFVAQKTLPNKPVKLGPAKLRETLLAESTDSAKQASKTLRIQTLTMRQATVGAQLKRKAVSGIISSISEGVITIVHQIQQDRMYTVYTNVSTVVTMKGIEGATSADLAVNMRVAAVGELAGDGILAKRIHVIPGKAIGVYNKSGISSESGMLTITPSPEATFSGFPTTTATGEPTITPTGEPTVTESPVETPTDTEFPTPTS